MSALVSNDIKKKNGGEMAPNSPQSMRLDELEGSSIGLVATVPLEYEPDFGSNSELEATVPLHYTTPTLFSKNNLPLFIKNDVASPLFIKNNVASITRSIEMLPRDQQQRLISRFINQVAPTIEGVMNSPVATKLNASLIAGGGTTKSAIDEGKRMVGSSKS
jgi:hypothetical protein